MNMNKKDVSKLHSLETRFSKKIIACAITLSVGASAFPLSTFAATISGVRFIDSTPFAVSPINNISGNDTVYNVDGYILFKRAGFASQFSTPVVGGNYSINLPDGNYKMWQYVDTSATLLTSSQFNSIQWATEANALNVSISGSSILVSTATGTPSVSSGTINFPYPNFTESTSLPSEAFQSCDVNNATDRKIVCGVDVNTGSGGISLPSGLTCDFDIVSLNFSGNHSFPGTPGGPPTASETTFSDKRVFIYGTVPVTDYKTYASPIKVKSLCNHGTLKGTRDGFYFNGNIGNYTQGGDVNIEFTDYFVNFTEGSVIASNSNSPNLNGGNINITGANGLSGTLINQGVIKAGNANAETLIANYSSSPTVFSPFHQSVSSGGNIIISAINSFQYGTLLAGNGSDINFQSCSSAYRWGYYYNSSLGTPSSRGGSTTVNGAYLTIGANSISGGGIGGSILVNGESNLFYCNGNALEVKGGAGGNLLLPVWNFNMTQGIAALSGNSVYVEPNTIELSNGATITAETDVVIYGGDNYTLTIDHLAANAITAGRKIILATGAGGTIDLRGNAAKIFKAGDRVEIYTDNLLLDAGVTIESLVDAPNGVIRSGAKIIYHATITGSSQIETKAGETVNVQLDLRNASPKADSYTLQAKTNDGIVLNGLPSNISVEALKAAPLNLSFTVPTNLASESTTITITATSQADPTVIATFELRVTVPQITCTNPATYDTATRVVNLPKIDIPLLSPIDGKETGEIAVFSAQLEQVSGVDDFKILPNSLQFLNFSKTYDPSHARYNFNTGLFSNGGLLKTCAAVPQVIVIPPNIPIYTTPKHYLVTLRQLAVSADTFHVETFSETNP